MNDNIVKLRPNNPAGIMADQLYVREFRHVCTPAALIFDVAKMFTDGYLIAFRHSGEGRVVMANAFRPMHPGDALVVKAGEAMEIFNDTGHCYLLHIDGPKASGIYEKLMKKNRSPIMAVMNPEKMKVTFSRMEACLQGDYRPYKLTAYIFNILAELNSLEIEGKTYQNEDLITKSITFIEEKFSEDLHVDEIAKVANLSKYYFTKEFKKITGVTPIQYLIRKRINHAEYLLENTERSVFQISSESGFNTEVNFFYHFKKANNCTPNDYRKLHHHGGKTL